jgi:hypothetical protein
LEVTRSESPFIWLHKYEEWTFPFSRFAIESRASHASC